LSSQCWDCSDYITAVVMVGYKLHSLEAGDRSAGQENPCTLKNIKYNTSITTVQYTTGPYSETAALFVLSILILSSRHWVTNENVKLA
jgi:hypothetical protein